MRRYWTMFTPRSTLPDIFLVHNWRIELYNTSPQPWCQLERDFRIFFSSLKPHGPCCLPTSPLHRMVPVSQFLNMVPTCSKMFQTYLGAARSKNLCTCDIFCIFCEHLAPSCGWPASPTLRRPAFLLLLCNFLRRANDQFQKLANKFGGHVTMLQESVFFLPYHSFFTFKILTVFK